MEFWCHYCRDWQDADYCETHFDSAHGQKKVTFEALQTRMQIMGGLETRDTPPDEPTEVKPKSWMWRDDNTDPNAPIITNNFQHRR